MCIRDSEDAANMDVESIVKTGGNTAYSKFAYDHVAHIDEDGDKDDSLISKINRLPILNLDQIKYQLTGYSDDPTDDYAQQYSVAQSFAVVSAIFGQENPEQAARTMKNLAQQIVQEGASL